MPKISSLAAVIGHPVSHSLSPKIFGILSDVESLPVLYKKLDIAPKDLNAFVSATAKLDLFTGWNVTVPHKEKILAHVDELSEEVKAIGAANVVHFKSQTATAFNTDVYGIKQTLHEQDVRLQGSSALLYGAGGAAKAVAFALGREKVAQVWVVNRTRSRAEALCRKFGKLFPKTKFRTATVNQCKDLRVTLLVNATSVGLPGNAAAFEFPHAIDAETLAFDLIYGPKLTSFLTQAGKRGARTVNGLDMLIWQAIATWEIWFGKVEDRDGLKHKLRRALS